VVSVTGPSKNLQNPYAAGVSFRNAKYCTAGKRVTVLEGLPGFYAARSGTKSGQQQILRQRPDDGPMAQGERWLTR
jgi:hypothetical protein